MAWFTAKCLYRNEKRGGIMDSPGILGEYRYFLIAAETEDDARVRSLKLGRDNEHSYANAAGGETSWVFESVIDVKEVLSEVLCEGVEVFSEYIP